MKFKVFDKEKKEFVDPQKFYIDCNGDIIEADYNLEPMTYYLDIVNDKFIPIFSADQKDINPELIDKPCNQKTKTKGS